MRDAPQHPRGLPVANLSVAPMMEWTDRHYRYFVRLLTARTQLWTEMVVADTILHSPVGKGFLRFHPAERPLVCQLGGSDPDKLARAARLVEEMGYDEVNLNCGCPSDRVAGRGAFGARLMFTPELVRDCVAAMTAAVAIPVSVKCRLGADHMDSYEAFADFIRIVSQGGCRSFVVHARKCLLKGLSPKDNRTIPPLRYDWVRRAAAEFPHLNIGINGGVDSMALAVSLLSECTPACSVEAEGASRLSSDGLDPVPPSAVVGGGGECAEGYSRDGAVPLSGGAPTSCSSDGTAAPPPAALAAAESHRRTCEVAVPLEGAAAAAGDLPCEATDGTPSTEPAAGGSSGPCCDDATPLQPMQSLLDPAPGADGSPAAVALLQPAVRSAASLFDSVMLGRLAYHNMWVLADADRAAFGVPNPGLSRRQVIAEYLCYAETVLDSVPEDERTMQCYHAFELVKFVPNMFTGCKGVGKLRQLLQHNLRTLGMPVREGLLDALRDVDDAVMDELPPRE